MARQQSLGSTDSWFIGEDKTLEFEIYESNQDGADSQDITGWTMAFYMRSIGGANPRVLTKTPTVAGTFNADPDTNTQRATVAIADTDTDNLQPGKYEFSLWRTDSGNETVLSFGMVDLKKAA